jgi:alkaline phosphatase
MNWTSAAGAQDITVWGDAYANARAGIPFINGSTSASNNGLTVLNMPGTFVPVASADKPETSTYSTYSGLTAYKLDPATGYPVNSGDGLRRLAVGYRTGDHTGSSVPVTAEGPGAWLFTGYMDQTDIFFKMASAISTDTSEGDKFVDTVLNSTKNIKTIGK